jgi:hypothetical protein
MVVGQKIALGRIHAVQVVSVHVAQATITIDLADGDSRTVRRVNGQVDVPAGGQLKVPAPRGCFSLV